MPFGNDFFSNYFNKSSTTTENETESSNEQTMFGSQNTITETQQTYQSPYETDDYTTNQNFFSQTNYNPTQQQTSFGVVQEQKKTTAMDVPMIERSTPAVNLVKKQAKIRLEARMKIVLSVFCVIVASLLFITVFNFIQANKIQSTFADKQIEIKNLEQSISGSKSTYTLVSDEDYIKNWAESNNYVEKNADNYAVISLDDLYEEETAPEIESNWFNDVCEFLSRLFA